MFADRLAEGVKRAEPTISIAVEAIAELDWYVPPERDVHQLIRSLLALATAARNFCLVKPIMTDRPVLEINEGRHLIQEQLVQDYVKNDTLLQGGYEDGYNSMVCDPDRVRSCDR
jgi:DNA mismatch repair protein MSH5